MTKEKQSKRGDKSVTNELKAIKTQILCIKQQHYSTLYSDDHESKVPDIYGQLGVAARSLRVGDTSQKLELFDQD